MYFLILVEEEHKMIVLIGRIQSGEKVSDNSEFVEKYRKEFETILELA